MTDNQMMNIPLAVVKLTETMCDQASRALGTDGQFFPAAFNFKRDHSLQARIEEAKRIADKYPDRIPVICTKRPVCQIPDIDKHKFLVPMDLTVGQFMYVVRKRMHLSDTQATFFFVGETLPAASTLMKTVFEMHKDVDGFLYMVFSTEDTFG